MYSFLACHSCIIFYSVLKRAYSEKNKEGGEEGRKRTNRSVLRKLILQREKCALYILHLAGNPKPAWLGKTAATSINMLTEDCQNVNSCRVNSNERRRATRCIIEVRGARRDNSPIRVATAAFVWTPGERECERARASARKKGRRTTLK